MKLSALVPCPFRAKKVECPRQFLGRRREVGVLNAPSVSSHGVESARFFLQRDRGGAGIEAVEKVSQTPIKGVTLSRQRRDFRQTSWSHIFPSSNKPSNKYCARIGMRFSG